jgi:formate hydrogenlyase transcriptional activator
VRELQNVIERSVIVCDTEEFLVDGSWLTPVHKLDGAGALTSRLSAYEKALIEEALLASGGQVFGPTGAAARLRLPRTTLESRIRALRINKSRFRRQPG